MYDFPIRIDSLKSWTLLSWSQVLFGIMSFLIAAILVVPGDSADLMESVLYFVVWLLPPASHVVIENVLRLLEIADVAHERTQAGRDCGMCF